MDWKKIGRKLLFPPVWLVVILAVASAAGLAYVFLNGLDTAVIACLIYVLAFYTLTVVCAFCAAGLPGQVRRIRQRVMEDKLGNRYMTDVEFRTNISLYLSLGINLLYALMNVWSWYTNRSAWFVILAAYYAILAVMRFVLVRYTMLVGIGKDMVRELKQFRLCAVILLLVNVTLSCAVLMMLYQNRGYDYGQIMIYVMAMCTFYVTGHAIVDIVKYRKYNSPVMSAAKVISLTGALVSLLNLETAMFAAFGAEMAQEDQRIIIILTGAGVAVIVVTMSVYMIVKANREIKIIRSKNNG